MGSNIAVAPSLMDSKHLSQLIPAVIETAPVNLRLLPRLKGIAQLLSKPLSSPLKQTYAPPTVSTRYSTALFPSSVVARVAAFCVADGFQIT